MSKPAFRLSPAVALIVIIAVLFGWLSFGRSTQAPKPGVLAGAPLPQQTAVTSPASPARPREPAVGDFFILVDVSASLLPREDPARREDILAVVRQSVVALRGMEEVLPTRLRVATIADRGLDQRALCDLYLPTKHLFIASDSAELTTALAQCLDALGRITPTRYTDIRGSVKFAGEGLEGTEQRLRGIILVTDSLEELAPGSEPAVPSLNNICVATYVQPNAEGARHPVEVDDRIRDWSAQLTKWHVRRRQVRYLAAFSTDDVQGFFRGCEP